jgi:hypothetical protein
MNGVRRIFGGVLLGAVCVTAIPALTAAAETFAGTATVKTAGGATATAPLTLTVDRKMAPAEADKLVAAFKAGGVAGLRKALEGVAPTGSIALGGGKPTRTRITIERSVGNGRLITAVTDTPLLHMGAGLPGAKATAGYDFAVVDLEIAADGRGTGTLTPAARLKANGSAFVVDGYSSEPLRVTSVAVKK